ncbi:hypothetical protein [Pseudomonas muyukensis]|uniref:Uncharacterized protein n=1 Tax=Pseudomonas muyukensis TaxID=2842357 RepID=A0ABX8MD86_9PSED|nr:hypothetical protein [Pseudomonas muyukensis]QXH37040.1 hypothetical protein KSS95_09505 [Pseudomonas muyukensis]
MDDSLHAARKGDLILHPPLMADLVSAVSEAVIYAAVTEWASYLDANGASHYPLDQD